MQKVVGSSPISRLREARSGFRLECWLDHPDGNRYVAELRLVAVDRAQRNWHAPGSA
jgi:hypothetical protein